jgi:hypothetical protein
MALPTPLKLWTSGMLVNQRITFVSLLNTTGEYVVGNTNRMIAQGMTCVGSSNGVTAAMDGTNRCTTSAGFAVRGANTTTAQSWIVISDGVVQILFAFTGASDDIARVSFSPGSLFVVAGTATFAPTATDEQVVLSGASIVGSTASGDRVYTVWVDSTHRHWRSAVFRSGVPIGPFIGVELYDPSSLVSPAAAPTPVWGFAQTATNISNMGALAGGFTANTTGGVTRATFAAGSVNVQLGGSFEIFQNSSTQYDAIATEAQGGQFIIQPLGLSSITGNARGKIGNRIDWYHTGDNQTCGALTADLKWVILNNQGSPGTGGALLWPWDGVTTSCVTS